MFVTLQGENYTANFYLFLIIYPLNHEENSEKFERQFQCFFSNSARQLEVALIRTLRCRVASVRTEGDPVLTSQPRQGVFPEMSC